MKQILSIMILLGLALQLVTAQSNDNTATLARHHEPARVHQGDRSSLLVFFNQIQQGRAALIAVETVSEAEVSGLFNQSALLFYQTPQTGMRHYALVTASIDQPIRDNYPLSVTVTYPDGFAEELRISVAVSSGGFIQQEVTLLPDQLWLIDPEVEAAELALIDAITSDYNSPKLWDERGFIVPVNAALTSPFGAVRIFNGTLTTIHTGWDFQAQIGRPMVASASGKVAFAGHLDIRGNYVLIDHGLGVYSGYAHLSVIHVAQGQTVRAGQIIGQVGSTGRSSSAHAHVEFLVGGRWIDAADFIRLNPP